MPRTDKEKLRDLDSMASSQGLPEYTDIALTLLDLLDGLGPDDIQSITGLPTPKVSEIFEVRKRLQSNRAIEDAWHNR